jgi:7-cyano-7-deazaguanine reductase
MTHEEATNRIYEDLKKILKPRFLEVIGDFNVRGGLKTTVKVAMENSR